MARRASADRASGPAATGPGGGSDEALAASHAAHLPADEIVLGQAQGVKQTAFVSLGQALENIAAISRPHSGRRNEAASAVPKNQILGVELREFVGVGRLRHPPERRDQRPHGELDHLVTVDLAVDVFQRGGRNQVLGVLLLERGVAFAGSFFVPLDAFVNPIEAIGLGRRAGVRADDMPHPRMIPLASRDLVECGGVVGIDAQPHIVVFIFDSGEVVIEHAFDHPGFAPTRDDDGDLALRQLCRLGPGHGGAGPAARP